MSKKQEPITFFIDHCVSQKIVPEALRAAGAIVETHVDHFAIDALDTEWLPEVSQRGWVVITKDWALNSNFLEQKAIAASNARVFVLASCPPLAPNYGGKHDSALKVPQVWGI